ncbi:THAP domaincontaining protein 9like, partial [Caligus rogercresseyi]
MVLPHPSIIKNLYGSIDASQKNRHDSSPGLTVESFEALKIRVEQQQIANGKKGFCNLTLDQGCLGEI